MKPLSPETEANLLFAAIILVLASVMYLSGCVGYVKHRKAVRDAYMMGKNIGYIDCIGIWDQDEKELSKK